MHSTIKFIKKPASAFGTCLNSRKGGTIAMTEKTVGQRIEDFLRREDYMYKTKWESRTKKELIENSLEIAIWNQLMFLLNNEFDWSEFDAEILFLLDLFENTYFLDETLQDYVSACILPTKDGLREIILQAIA